MQSPPPEELGSLLNLSHESIWGIRVAQREKVLNYSIGIFGHIYRNKIIAFNSEGNVEIPNEWVLKFIAQTIGRASGFYQQIGPVGSITVNLTLTNNKRFNLSIDEGIGRSYHPTLEKELIRHLPYLFEYGKSYP